MSILLNFSSKFALWVIWRSLLGLLEAVLAKVILAVITSPVVIFFL
jgi:hypothetical protein